LDWSSRWTASSRRSTNLTSLPVVQVDTAMVLAAVKGSQRHRLSFWDALIIEAARAAGCKRVSSEDLQTGQDFDGVTVENPFE